MTGSLPAGLPTQPGHPALMSEQPHASEIPGTVTQRHDLSAAQIVRRPAPPSRPCGRSAVALRASHDRDASHRRALEPANTPKKRSRTTLDRPRSFRDDPLATVEI